MSEPQREIFGNLELAKVIEREAAVDDAAYVTAMKRLFPQESYSVFEFPGGSSLFVGRSPFTTTHGFGTDKATHHEELLTKIESFYERFDFLSSLSLPSVADNEIWKLMARRGYQIVAFRNVYAYVANGELPASPGMDIREAESEEELRLWLQVVSDGFAGKELTEPDTVSLGQSTKTGNRFFIGFVDGRPAAASALYMRGDFARLGGMGTLVQHRGKGLQQAMIRQRLELAIKSGCKLITSDTTPGNNSQRNLERLGFKLVYVRSIMRKG